MTELLMGSGGFRARIGRVAAHWCSWAVCLGVGCSPMVSSADTAQVWYQNTVFYRLNERWSVGNYLDFRMTDAVGELATTMVSPRVRYDLNPNWSAQINTTWLEAQAADERGRTKFSRLEMEANPRYVLTEGLTFSARNRFELRWVEDTHGTNERIRVRPQLDLRTPWAGPIHGIFANNETFYDFDRGLITENRLTPLGLVFRPSEALELRVYHLWRHTRVNRTWVDFQALGMMLNLNFH